MWQDRINAVLEAIASVAMYKSARKVRRDKVVRGVSLFHVAYSVTSSWWFTYYYAHLDQQWSLLCAVAYALATATWATMVVFYVGREILCGDEL